MPEPNSALTRFADECRGTLVRLIAYVGTLALIAILGLHLADQSPAIEFDEPAAKAGSSYPAFAVNPMIHTKNQKLIRVAGIPKVAARMSLIGPLPAKSRLPNSKFIAPGGEFGQSRLAFPELAVRMDPGNRHELETVDWITAAQNPRLRAVL